MFRITEWPAARAEKWAIKAILAYNRGGADMSLDTLVGRGMEAIFFMGVHSFLQGQIKAEEIVPILDELLQCVQIIRDPATMLPTDIISDDDIEEIRTRIWLRGEVLTLHLGFSVSAAFSALISSIMKSPETSSSI